jgi:Flp pilus assembly protein TadD/glycosyltransferase involved in cell wall biosynthesis
MENPSITEDKYQEAVNLFNRGSLTEAENILINLIEENNQDFDVLNFLGIIKLNAKQYEEAAGYFQKVISLRGAHIHACYNLGLCYQNMEDYDNALLYYQKTTEIDTNHFDAINNMGVIYLVLKEFANAESCFNFCLSIRPDDPMSFNNLGNTNLKLEKYSEAKEFYQKAIDADPSNSLFYFNLGTACQKNGEDDAALGVLTKAVHLNPEYDDAYNGIALIHLKNSRYKEAEECFAKISQNRYSKAVFLTNKAVSKMSCGCLPEARVLLEEALALEPESPEIHYNYSHLLLLLGDFKNGLREYEWRTKRPDFQGKKIKKPLEPSVDVNGLRILIKAEQGLGDSIQFARYIKQLKEKGAYTIFECDVRLHSLFKDAGYIDRLIPFENNIDASEFDYEIYLLSLPFYFNTEADTIPAKKSYLYAEEEYITKWEKIINNSSNFKAGIVWAGNPKHTGDKKRSCSLKDFIPLFSNSKTDFFVLQKGDSLVQVKDIYYPLIITDSYNEGFADLAAAIHCLDLIITVDTSIAHLAGAMGKETWLLIPYMPDWRWMLDRSDSPWYPSIKIFRQTEPDNWSSVFISISKELERKTNGEKMTLNSLKRPYNNIDKYFDIIESHVYPEVSSGLHSDITRQVIDKLVNMFAFDKNIKILDIGCGQGPALDAFSKLGFTPSGITLGDEDVNVCRQKGYDVRKMDQSFLDFSDNEFDLIWARHVLEHSVMPLLTLMEYHRVMKPGALVYIEVPGGGTVCHHETNPNHYSVLSATMWESLLQKAGFGIIESFIIPLELTIGKDEYLSFICRCEKKDEIISAGNAAPLYLGLSGGENFGWGVCSKYIKKEFQKIVPFTNIDENPELIAGAKVTGTVFHAMKSVNLEPLYNVFGDYNVAYTFFENEPSDKSIENAKLYDLVLAGSVWCKNKLVEKGIKPADVLLQGIDPELFYPESGKETNNNLFTIFSGGKFEYRKGQDLVLKAVKILQQRYKDIVLVNAWYNYWPEVMQTMFLTKHINFEMYGTSWAEFMSRLYEINELDASKIITLPLIPNNKLRELYLKTDIALFPNRCEGGTNLVMMEYMACGKPVIASYNSGHMDVLSEQNALLLKNQKEIKLYTENGSLDADWSEPDMDEIISRIEYAYNHRQEIKQIGEKAGEDMAKLTWADTANNLLKFLRK